MLVRLSVLIPAFVTLQCFRIAYSVHGEFLKE